MPWSVDDVDEFKKGLSPEDKQKWVDIANNVLKGCMEAGGSEENCAAKAVKVANAKTRIV